MATLGKRALFLKHDKVHVNRDTFQSHGLCDDHGCQDGLGVPSYPDDVCCGNPIPSLCPGPCTCPFLDLYHDPCDDPCPCLFLYPWILTTHRQADESRPIDKEYRTTLV